MIELCEVTKVFCTGRREVASVRGVSLRVGAGEFVAIMGPSGSGKSTLLHLMGGLEPPTAGRVLFGGADLATFTDRTRSKLRLHKIGLVFQFFNLLPALTAAENVALPLLLDGQGRAQSRQRALAALEEMRLLARADHLPEELSGGEMQRVAIARALVSGPELLLCDEPTGALDSATGQQVLELLRRLPKVGGRSVVMVTHDAQAAAYSDRVVHMRDGLIEAEEPWRGRHALAVEDA